MSEYRRALMLLDLFRSCIDDLYYLPAEGRYCAISAVNDLQKRIQEAEVVYNSKH